MRHPYEMGGTGGKLFLALVQSTGLNEQELEQANCGAYVRGEATSDGKPVEFDRDNDNFFDGQNHLVARTICNECPIRLRCLETALERDSDRGVYGGATRPERQKLKRRMREEDLTAEEAALEFDFLGALADTKRLHQENIEREKRRVQREAMDLEHFCPSGHERKEDNIHVRYDGRKECNECRLERQEKYNANKRKRPKRIKDHCFNGHEFTEENTFIRKNGNRFCRTCRKNRDQEKRKRNE